MSRPIETIGVIGSGTMGNGIAQVCATAGFHVLMKDIQDEFLDRGLKTIDKSLSKFVEKGKLAADRKNSIMKNIGTTSTSQPLAGCDFVIEAASENFEIKKQIFQELDSLCRPDVIFGSNTSSISITRLAAQTRRPDKCIGMHFMNPVPLMTLVEIIRGLATSDETYAATKSLAEKLGKVPCEVNDSPGFVSNRVLMPMINEAIYCVMEGVGKPESIDTVMKLGMNHPMGPLTLADLIGLDVCLDIMEVLYQGFADSKYRPCPLLRKMVAAGCLGRKSGRGFYEYQ
ncbi:MAG: 3-hydroxybutyryl-CoA dehydrogenase [Acidobacteriia bacterium]|nr:3-hydroxybutyryl-CoA dehydrogenase [Terriglobia bacterium]